jgi:putative glutathione S-transferase
MQNSAFNSVGASGAEYYPEELRTEIDEINEYVYPTINNGVYRAGFAITQDAYDEGVVDLFAALDKLEERLTSRRYQTGTTIA